MSYVTSIAASLVNDHWQELELKEAVQVILKFYYIIDTIDSILYYAFNILISTKGNLVPQK